MLLQSYQEFFFSKNISFTSSENSLLGGFLVVSAEQKD